MSSYSPTFAQLVEKLRSLPGVGAKSAHRLAFHIVGLPDEEAFSFAEAITQAKKTIRRCERCMNISDEELCAVCGDGRRDSGLICVVESARDITAFERIKEYSGVYHVLHGVISPMDGIGPDKITVKELLARIETDEVREVILATGSSVEGEATAIYISKLLKPMGITVSRLAYGIPVGGELEYTDEVTLYKALEGRREML